MISAQCLFSLFFFFFVNFYTLRLACIKFVALLEDTHSRMASFFHQLQLRAYSNTKLHKALQVLDDCGDESAFGYDFKDQKRRTKHS